MKRISFIALVFILTACTIGRHSEFNRNQQKWTDANIQHYRFQLSVGCFCPYSELMPLSVEVLNGKVVSIATKDGSVVAHDDQNYDSFARYATIESLFTELKADLNGNADQVTVTYDPTYGFPATMNIDFIKNAADDELYLSATGFEKLP